MESETISCTAVKEDLEDSLSRASRQQRQLNPALRKGDIQVHLTVLQLVWKQKLPCHFFPLISIFFFMVKICPVVLVVGLCIGGYHQSYEGTYLGSSTFDIRLLPLDWLSTPLTRHMQESSAASKWDDIVFIPPGFNVSTDLTESAQG